MHNTNTDSVFDQLSDDIDKIDVLDLMQLSHDDIMTLIDDNDMTQDQEDTLIRFLMKIMLLGLDEK